MRIDLKRDNRGGKFTPYTYAVAKFRDESGRRRSKHLPCKHDPDDFIGMSMVLAKITKTRIEPAVMAEVKQWVEERTGLKEWQHKPRKERPRKKEGMPGRPTRLPAAARELLKAAGYAPDGARIHRDMKTFFTMETASVRYAELHRELRSAIGSAPEYLHACIKAEHDLKSASRHGFSGMNFEAFLAEELQRLVLPE